MNEYIYGGGSGVANLSKQAAIFVAMTPRQQCQDGVVYVLSTTGGGWQRGSRTTTRRGEVGSAQYRMGDLCSNGLSVQSMQSA